MENSTENPNAILPYIFRKFSKNSTKNPSGILQEIFLRLLWKHSWDSIENGPRILPEIVRHFFRNPSGIFFRKSFWNSSKNASVFFSPIFLENFWDTPENPVVILLDIFGVFFRKSFWSNRFFSRILAEVLPKFVLESSWIFQETSPLLFFRVSP